MAKSSVLFKKERAEGAVDDDRVYEEIEAPKFVDFTVPDMSRPDDGSWFCARVGCDQKHEEVDPEALLRSFYLRVMAARSPNVRFQKTLSNQAQSRIVKCPRTAPVKSARVQKLTNMASIPERIKAHPISSLRATPVSKVKQNSVIAKPLTTPRSKKCPLGDKALEGIKHSKPTDAVPINTKMVGKGLVFGTPKKVQKPSTNHRTPVSEMCSGMKKLIIGSRKKPAFRKGTSESSIDMEIDGKSRDGSMKDPTVPVILTSDQDKGGADDPDISSNEGTHHDNDEGKDERAEEETQNFDDKENAPAVFVAELNSDRENNTDHTKDTDIPNKTLQERSAQRGKYKKLKATNPKPFRLRTDERSVLKEANLERRLQLDAMKEMTPVRVKTEPSTITPQRRKWENSKESTTPKPQKMMRLMSSHKPVNSPSVAAAKKTGIIMRPKEDTHKKTGILKPKEEDEAEPVGNNNTSGMKPTPSSRTKSKTIPREPKFNTIHVPRSCTKRSENAVS